MLCVQVEAARAWSAELLRREKRALARVDEQLLQLDASSTLHDVLSADATASLVAALPGAASSGRSPPGWSGGAATRPQSGARRADGRRGGWRAITFATSSSSLSSTASRSPASGGGLCRWLIEGSVCSSSRTFMPASKSSTTSAS